MVYLPNRLAEKLKKAINMAENYELLVINRMEYLVQIKKPGKISLNRTFKICVFVLIGISNLRTCYGFLIMLVLIT
jgi:hypothetical protein